ncbi:OpcA protein [Stanieria cyanosphaera PCC 7437]|uniref:OpcA protein n=1 Tax=Stanieria cyanosphaera (strain ATCC 29371 / PCC 7437) TaxID=111780 RepID=K9XY05_STAC7|nr:glucose-6-phosphate dehydrogenase assembly protein OpcA [Stanieria cyanosphaera]AFZ36537.1 OpcA protein [Stanieria cyanosphaera PCC 7437]
MATSQALVSLQAPKDVSIEEIEAELRQLWLSTSEEGAATRAATFSLVVYEPDGTQQLLASLGFYTGPIDGIAGPRTEAAVKAAEKAYGMEVTGKSSSKLRQKLEAEFASAKQQDKQTLENQTTPITYSPDSDGAGMADAIASSNPCRIITLIPILGDDQGVTAQVSAYCPINKQSTNNLVCCEYITLSGTAEALERIGGVISELMIGDLPKFIWWKATPAPEYPLFKRLVSCSDSIIFDSSSFIYPEADLIAMGELIQQGVALTDLNWKRLAPWQELTAEAFDPPERRAAIYEVDQVTVDYEKGNQSQALMFLGWLASRLSWTPTSYQLEGGDYEIRKIKFTDDQQREIVAELAGIPTADWGDIPGDLISLRLSSTNQDADCCTVLCSSATGCMRMEAGGGAQACYIQQVAPLSDQNTEELLSQQLRRWGREMLYEESMAVTHQILQLKKTD